MRKRRTRQHLIEDLSYIYVEKQAVLAFCTLERFTHRQYSYDGLISTFDPRTGELEPGHIFVQIKATDNLKYSAKNKGYELRLNNRDLELWAKEVFPIFLVLYDAKSDSGYFIEMGEHFNTHRTLLSSIHQTKKLFIPAENLFDQMAIQKFRITKNSFYAKLRNV